jgi:hypothetical protein
MQDACGFGGNNIGGSLKQRFGDRIKRDWLKVMDRTRYAQVFCRYEEKEAAWTCF